MAKIWQQQTALKKFQVLGSGCGSVGRAFASNTRGPVVRIQTTANFYRTFIIYCQLYCIEKTTLKEKEAGNGPFFLKKKCQVKWH